MGVYNTETGNFEPSTVEEIYDGLINEYITLTGSALTPSGLRGTKDGQAFYFLAQVFAGYDSDVASLSLKYKDFLALQNETIKSPVTTSDGIVQALADAGYTASVKSTNILADAGKSFICVKGTANVEMVISEQKKVAKVISDSIAEGIHTEGSIDISVELSTGQPKSIKFSPETKKRIYLRVTRTIERDQPLDIMTEADAKQLIYDNFVSLCTLGEWVKPYIYFQVARDAPYCASVQVEWKLDATAYSTNIYQSLYTDYFYIQDKMADITIVDVYLP